VPTSGGPRASSTTSALTVAQIGKVLGVSRTSIYRALDKDAAAETGR